MENQPLTIADVTCPVCGCVCDDLEAVVANNQLLKIHRACPLAEPWFLGVNQTTAPVALIDGSEVPLEEAFSQAKTLLSDSRMPVIYGLSRSSTAGQRAATLLAEKLHAVIDTTASRCHAPSVMALQEVGESTCSLGEVKNRADLVLFWGADPAQSHPRHGERYSIDATGEFIPNGRSDRRIVVVDAAADNQTAAIADQHLRLPPGTDFEALMVLRAILQGKPISENSVQRLPMSQLRQLADQMRQCQFGVVFFGLALSMGSLGHRSVEQLLLLVRELNDHTRFYARRLRIQGDVTGADSVLAWQTGFPFSVSLQRGMPMYNPGEFTVNDMLERGEPDLCLFVGSEGIAQFSDAARTYLQTIPTIVLDYPQVQSLVKPTVRFTTSVYGIHEPGTVYRMDEIPIPLKAILNGTYPTDEHILQRLCQDCHEGT